MHYCMVLHYYASIIILNNSNLKKEYAAMLNASNCPVIISLERAKMRALILFAELVSRKIYPRGRFFPPNSLVYKLIFGI